MSLPFMEWGNITLGQDQKQGHNSLSVVNFLKIEEKTAWFAKTTKQNKIKRGNFLVKMCAVYSFKH